jgi:hypothetical protein
VPCCGDEICFGETPFAGMRLKELLLYVVLTDEDGERPWPITGFLIVVEASISECFMSTLPSSLNSVLKVCKPVAVKGVGLDGGPRLLSRLRLSGFCDSDSTGASSSWSLFAELSRGLS